MELKTFFAQDLLGNVIPNPTVYVYQPGTTTLATGLQNEAGGALGNPFTGNVNGKISVAAPDGDYDIRVTGAGRDSTMRVRFIDSVAGSADILRTDLASSAEGKGADLVAFKQAGAGAVGRTALAKMRERVSVFDFMTAAQIDDVRSGTLSLDVTAAIQAAIDSLPANGGTVYVPPGDYLVGTLNFPNDPKVVNLVGAGKHATTLQMATAAGPMIRKTPTPGRITGALFSDFKIKAHPGSDKTNLSHKAMLLTGWNNSHFKRIAYKSVTTSSGSVGVVFDVASHPYLTYQNTFEGIDCSINYGPSRVFYLNNNGDRKSVV